MSRLSDTVAAISTPPGKGGVAVIRISGDDALSIAGRVFVSKSGVPVASFSPRMATYGKIVRFGEVVDDVVLTYFKAPSSYTGEDTVEISCHGGVLVTREVLTAVLSAGARSAEAGEFTRRAFINGRLTLTEAEAIGTLISAESKEQLRLASEPSRKKVTDRITKIKESLVGIMSSVYARIDYPDEDLGDYTDEELLSALYNIKEELSALISTYKTGKAICEGIKTVIIGSPNAGKSSLYNLLVGEDAAIVTSIAGTTRDLLTESVPLGRVMLRLTDTAGIRKTSDEVEAIGVSRALDRAKEAELLIAVFDTSRAPLDSDRETVELLSTSNAAKIVILNKSDLKRDKEWESYENNIKSIADQTLNTSIKCDTGRLLSEITECAERLFTDEKIKVGEDAIVFTARTQAELSRALEFVNTAYLALYDGHSQDTVSSDIERALMALSDSDAREVSEDIVSDIFSKFCVGK